jgi:hypothetical protein
MEAIEKLAISKVFKKPELDKARKDLAEGTHKVSVKVLVEGTVTVGSDYEMRPTAKALTLESLAIVLAHCGVTSKAAVPAIIRAMTGKKTNADLARQKTVDEIIARVKKAFDKLPPMPCNGKVTTDLEWYEDF